MKLSDKQGLPMLDVRDPRPSAVYAAEFARRVLRFTLRRLTSSLPGRRDR